jgi:hypothetical protein
VPLSDGSLGARRRSGRCSGDAASSIWLWRVGHRIAGRLRSKQYLENRQQLRILCLAFGTSTAQGTDALGRTLSQSGLKIAPPAADRAAIQARDPGQQRLAATTDAPGLECNEPTTLPLRHGPRFSSFMLISDT